MLLQMFYFVVMVISIVYWIEIEFSVINYSASVSTTSAMFQRYLFLYILVGFSIHLTSANYVNKSHTRPWKVRFYPKKSLFRKSDLIDKGCAVFIRECPKAYKQSLICARHYDGKYKTFNNYCEMEFENCNSWRQWSMIKRDRC